MDLDISIDTFDSDTSSEVLGMLSNGADFSRGTVLRRRKKAADRAKKSVSIAIQMSGDELSDNDGDEEDEVVEMVDIAIQSDPMELERMAGLWSVKTVDSSSNVDQQGSQSGKERVVMSWMQENCEKEVVCKKGTLCLSECVQSPLEDEKVFHHEVSFEEEMVEKQKGCSTLGETEEDIVTFDKVVQSPMGDEKVFNHKVTFEEEMVKEKKDCSVSGKKEEDIVTLEEEEEVKEQGSMVSDLDQFLEEGGDADRKDAEPVLARETDKPDNKSSDVVLDENVFCNRKVSLKEVVQERMDYRALDDRGGIITFQVEEIKEPVIIVSDFGHPPEVEQHANEKDTVPDLPKEAYVLDRKSSELAADAERKLIEKERSHLEEVDISCFKLPEFRQNVDNAEGDVQDIVQTLKQVVEDVVSDLPKEGDALHSKSSDFVVDSEEEEIEEETNRIEELEIPSLKSADCNQDVRAPESDDVKHMLKQIVKDSLPVLHQEADDPDSKSADFVLDSEGKEGLDKEEINHIEELCVLSIKSPECCQNVLTLKSEDQDVGHTLKQVAEDAVADLPKEADDPDSKSANFVLDLEGEQSVGRKEISCIEELNIPSLNSADCSLDVKASESDGEDVNHMLRQVVEDIIKRNIEDSAKKKEAKETQHSFGETSDAGEDGNTTADAKIAECNVTEQESQSIPLYKELNEQDDAEIPKEEKSVERLGRVMSIKVTTERRNLLFRLDTGSSTGSGLSKGSTSSDLLDDDHVTHESHDMDDVFKSEAPDGVQDDLVEQQMCQTDSEDGKSVGKLTMSEGGQTFHLTTLKDPGTEYEEQEVDVELKPEKNASSSSERSSSSDDSSSSSESSSDDDKKENTSKKGKSGSKRKWKFGQFLRRKSSSDRDSDERSSSSSESHGSDEDVEDTESKDLNLVVNSSDKPEVEDKDSNLIVNHSEKQETDKILDQRRCSEEEPCCLSSKILEQGPSVERKASVREKSCFSSVDIECVTADHTEELLQLELISINKGDSEMNDSTGSVYRYTISDPVLIQEECCETLAPDPQCSSGEEEEEEESIDSTVKSDAFISIEPIIPVYTTKALESGTDQVIEESIDSTLNTKPNEGMPKEDKETNSSVEQSFLEELNAKLTMQVPKRTSKGVYLALVSGSEDQSEIASEANEETEVKTPPMLEQDHMYETQCKDRSVKCDEMMGMYLPSNCQRKSISADKSLLDAEVLRKRKFSSESSDDEYDIRNDSGCPVTEADDTSDEFVSRCDVTSVHECIKLLRKSQVFDFDTELLQKAIEDGEVLVEDLQKALDTVDGSESDNTSIVSCDFSSKPLHSSSCFNLEQVGLENDAEPDDIERSSSGVGRNHSLTEVSEVSEADETETTKEENKASPEPKKRRWFGNLRSNNRKVKKSKSMETLNKNKSKSMVNLSETTTTKEKEKKTALWGRFRVRKAKQLAEELDKEKEETKEKTKKNKKKDKNKKKNKNLSFSDREEGSDKTDVVSRSVSDATGKVKDKEDMDKEDIQEDLKEEAKVEDVQLPLQKTKNKKHGKGSSTRGSKKKHEHESQLGEGSKESSEEEVESDLEEDYHAKYNLEVVVRSITMCAADILFLIGREKDPSKSEVARLIQQSLEQDRRRAEAKAQMDEDRRRQEEMYQRQQSLTDDIREDMTETTETASESSLLRDPDFLPNRNELDSGDYVPPPLPASPPPGLDQPPSYHHQSDVTSTEGHPDSLASDSLSSVAARLGVDEEESGDLVVDEFELPGTGSSSEPLTPEMDAQVLFVRLQEAQYKNAVAEAEMAKLKAKMIMLENTDSQKRHYEKRCEEMAQRLRDTEKTIHTLQGEMGRYQMSDALPGAEHGNKASLDLLEGSQGEYIQLEQELNSQYGTLEKKYSKAKKLIKEYQSREKEIMQEHDSVYQQQTEKEQQYNQIVKTLKDKIFSLERTLKATGVSNQSSPHRDPTADIVIPSPTVVVKKQFKPMEIDNISLISELDIEPTQSPSPEKSPGKKEPAPTLAPVERLNASKNNSFASSVPETELLDTSANKTKAQLGSAGSLSQRRPPTRRSSSGTLSSQENEDEEDEDEPFLQHGSSASSSFSSGDSTVRKNSKKKEVQREDEPPQYPAPPPPAKVGKTEQKEHVQRMDQPVNPLHGLLMEELKVVVLDSGVGEGEDQPYENVVVTQRGEIRLLETVTVMQEGNQQESVDNTKAGEEAGPCPNGQVVETNESQENMEGKSWKAGPWLDGQVVETNESQKTVDTEPGKAEPWLEEQVVIQKTQKGGRVDKAEDSKKTGGAEPRKEGQVKGQSETSKVGQGKGKTGKDKPASGKPKSVMAKLLKSPKKGKSAKTQGDDASDTSSVTSQASGSYEPNKVEITGPGSKKSDLIPTAVDEEDSGGVTLISAKTKPGAITRLFSPSSKSSSSTTSSSSSPAPSPAGGGGGITLLSMKPINTGYNPETTLHPQASTMSLDSGLRELGHSRESSSTTASSASDLLDESGAAKSMSYDFTSAKLTTSEESETFPTASGTSTPKKAVSTPSLLASGAESMSGYHYVPVTEWTPSHVCDWLKAVSMGQYKVNFYEKQVDGQQLLVLDNTKIKNLGITNSKERDSLKKRIKELKAAFEKDKKQREKEQKAREKLEKQAKKEKKKK